jgi:hypothetical protein
MNSYSPVSDFVATGLLLIVFAALVYNLVISWIFGRKSRRMYQDGAKWGGE